MIFDQCRIVLTFTVNDIIFHRYHMFFCGIIVICVYCRLNLMIYNINITLLQHNHTFLHIIIFISITLQKLQNNYYHCAKKLWGKTGIDCYYAITTIVSNPQFYCYYLKSHVKQSLVANIDMESYFLKFEYNR